MHETFDPRTVLRLLGELDRRDPKRRVFGAVAHQYRLNPPLPLSSIEAFEAGHGIVLPDDYLTFLTEIGNGGAGPYYGLFPFGQHDDGHGLSAWEGGGLVGDPSRPFPHEGPWNLPDSFWRREPDPPPETTPEEEDRMMEAWDRELEENYWNPAIMDGSIPICHLGCAYRQWLVVNGGQRGFVWADDRADQKGLRPLRDDEGGQVSFSGWYMNWLHESLRERR
jgi:hypothetical protein